MNNATLINQVEGMVTGSCVGPPTGSFFLPVGGQLYEVIYATYVASAPTEEEALLGLSSMLNQKFLKYIAPDTESFLFWRNESKITVEYVGDVGFQARTRVVILGEKT